jgi:hypothetical protein
VATHVPCYCQLQANIVRDSRTRSVRGSNACSLLLPIASRPLGCKPPLASLCGNACSLLLPIARLPQYRESYAAKILATHVTCYCQLQGCHSIASLTPPRSWQRMFPAIANCKSTRLCNLMQLACRFGASCFIVPLLRASPQALRSYPPLKRRFSVMDLYIELVCVAMPAALMLIAAFMSRS